MRYFLVVLLVFLATGCSVKTTVEVDADPNGSGAVNVILEMDAEAAAIAGDLDALRGTDLVDAGWQFDEDVAEDGSKTLKVSHAFSSTAEANALMAQITSDGGAFSGFQLTQESSGLSTSSQFKGSVDLSRGLASFGDDELIERTGQRLGFDPTEFFREYGTNEAEAFPVQLKVSLPGSAQIVSPTMADGVWSLPYGQVTPLELESSGLEWKILVYAALAIVFITAAVATFIFWRVEADEYIPRHVR